MEEMKEYPPQKCVIDVVNFLKSICKKGVSG